MCTTTRYKQPCSAHSIWCDFVVRTSTDLHIERLHWDSAFWSATMPRLQDFYFTVILWHSLTSIMEASVNHLLGSKMLAPGGRRRKLCNYTGTVMVIVCVQVFLSQPSPVITHFHLHCTPSVLPSTSTNSTALCFVHVHPSCLSSLHHFASVL